MTYYKLPHGVQDMLRQECFNFRKIENKLEMEFLKEGCSFVQTSTLDYYDTYHDIKNRIPQEQMFKLTDNDGSLLVLRPDATLSIARMAAKHNIKSGKLCYFSDVYKFSASGNQFREVAQAGVEFLGVTGAFSDAQAIAFAIKCLLAVGIEEFVVDISHVGYFKGILEESGLSGEECEKLRGYINSKDSVNIQFLLSDKTEEARDAILALPTLFGGVEVLDKAEKFTKNETALSSLKHLRKVYNFLKSFGLSRYVSFDLGTVKSLSYYSGVVFTGLCPQIGAPVLSGGRYDNVSDDFYSDCKAVGFAMGVKRVMMVLSKLGKLEKEENLYAIVCAQEGYEQKAFEECEKLRSQGMRTDLFAGDEKDVAEYAQGKCAQVLIVGADGVKAVEL